MPPLNHSSKKGFTLIELLVTVSVIAILATIGMMAFSSTQRSARDAKRKGDLEDIKNAIYLSKTATGGWCKTYGCPWSYVANNAQQGMEGTQAVTTAPYSLKIALVTPNYLKTAAHDPFCPAGTCSNSWSDYWVNIPDDTDITISAKLEVAPASGTLVGCSVQSASYNYCVGE